MNSDGIDWLFHPHAVNNWLDRTPDNSIPIWKAWVKAHSVGHVRSYFDKPEHEKCDEIRLYHGITSKGDEYSMLLLARQDTVITTFPYTGVSDNLVGAYLDELRNTTIFYE